MQIIHLLLADAVWITLLLLSATVLSTGKEEQMSTDPSVTSNQYPVSSHQ
jgi:hypothetical protein